MKRRRLFFAAYSFPPRVSSGVFRAVKFVKYLPEFFDGEVHVVTAPADGGPGDPDLEKDVEGRCIVHRVDSSADPKYWKKFIKQCSANADSALWKRALWRIAGFAYKPFYGLYNGLKKCFLFPDGKLFWSSAAMNFLVRDFKMSPGDVLLTTSPEKSLLVAAEKLKRKLPEVRWVVDFRDGWYGNPFNFSTRNPIRLLVESRMEKKVFDKADAIICATDTMAEVYCSRYPEAASKVSTIFNGFDPADFDDSEPVALKGEGLHIVYTGRIGGTYNTEFLLAALAHLKKSDPSAFSALFFHFAGSFENDENRWKELLGDRFIYHGRLPHAQAVRLMMSGDLLLLLLDEAHGGVTVYSGKVFEYIKAGKPILALAPECGAASMIKKHELGFVVPFNEPEAISAKISTAVKQWRTKNLHVEVPESFLAKFDRRNTAAQLAKVIAPSPCSDN